MKWYWIYSIALCVVWFSCDSQKKEENKGPVLVSIYGKKLYYSEIDTATLNTLSGVDSVEFLLQQENAWINEQILLKEADIRLSPKEKKLVPITRTIKQTLNSKEI